MAATKKNLKKARTINEHDFTKLDTWARGLTLDDGRPLSVKERREHERAKRVGRGRPAKPLGEKAGRYMVSMDPALHKAAVRYSRAVKTSLSGLIAGALADRIDFNKR